LLAEKKAVADISERALWGKYQAAYQELIHHTATPVAPWYVVPADHKWFARVVIGSVIVNALDALDLKFPEVDASHAGGIQAGPQGAGE
jgi:polyphosphate kinase 2 (PPK2 family)